MRICSIMSVASAIVILVMFGACAGSETPEPSTAAAVETDDAPEPASADTNAKPGESDEGDDWEGEGDAVSAPGGSEEQVEETRTMEVIQKLVKDQRKPVRNCYEQARKELPSLQGDLVIHFVLDPEGNVKKAELNQQRSTLKSPPVTQCAIDVIKKIKFPPSSRGMETKVNYPYNLTP